MLECCTMLNMAHKIIKGIRLPDDAVNEIELIAKKKHLTFSAVARSWLMDRIEEEKESQAARPGQREQGFEGYQTHEQIYSHTS